MQRVRLGHGDFIPASGMNRATQIRLDKGLRVEDVVKGAGISPHTLRKVEMGETVRAGALVRLADFYEVDQPTALLGPPVFTEKAA
jgi:transcriptional regulator with XRE-family HTH domain